MFPIIGIEIVPSFKTTFCSFRVSSSSTIISKTSPESKIYSDSWIDFSIVFEITSLSFSSKYDSEFIGCTFVDIKERVKNK